MRAGRHENLCNVHHHPGAYTLPLLFSLSLKYFPTERSAQQSIGHRRGS